MYVNRKEEEEGETEQQQTYQFTKGYNILHRLQVHHLTISTLYLYTYIHIYYDLFLSQQFFDTINIRYEYIKKNDRSRQEFMI